MSVLLSCTTTIPRFPIFYYGIQSLLSQNVTPDKFIINIENKSALVKNLFQRLPDKLDQDIIEIHEVKDIGPYTKLNPTLKYATDNDLIITADDDVIYHENWLKELLEGTEKHPESIITGRARFIRKNPFGSYKNYIHWDFVRRQTTGMNILPTGVGGIVYKKSLLDLEFIKDPQFRVIAPSTDDLWYREASIRKNTSVTVFPEIGSKMMQINHDKSLFQDNDPDASNLNVSYLQKALRIVKSTLGFNQSENDHAWKRIKQYSKEHPIV